MNKLNVVDYLSFGSESGNTDELNTLASIFVNEPPEYILSLKKYIAEGLPFPKARNNALIEYLSIKHKNKNFNYINEILKNPNNILAIEYYKSIIRLKSNIKPITIKRAGDNYNEKEIFSKFPSATAIRDLMKSDKPIEMLMNFLPLSNYNLISELTKGNYDFPFQSKMFNYIKYKGLLSRDELKKIPDASEGLHNKIYKSLLNSNNFDELMSVIKSKRYSYSRLSRILCQYYIGFEKFNTGVMRKEAMFLRTYTWIQRKR